MSDKSLPSPAIFTMRILPFIYRLRLLFGRALEAAARIRGVSHEAIRNLVQRGRLKSYTIGGKVFLSRKEVEAFKPDAGGRPKKKTGKKRGNYG